MDRCSLTSETIPLAHAKFSIVPELLQKFDVKDPELANIELTYRKAHMMVFDREPEDRISKWNKASRVMQELANEFNCSVRMVMVSVMLAHKLTGADQLFYSNMLLGNSAKGRLKAFKSEAQKQYASFNIETLEKLTGNKMDPYAEDMLRSEILFGQFIVNYKLGNAGKTPLDLFYNQTEHELDPVWLAIEPTYKPILDRHIQKQEGTKFIQEHRYHVGKAHVALKRAKLKAALVFKSREAIMQRAIEEVLRPLHFDIREFDVEPEPITDIFRFWSRLGLAVLRCVLHDYLDNRRSDLDMLSKRKMNYA